MPIIANDKQEPDLINDEQRRELIALLFTSSYEGKAAVKMHVAICGYNLDEENYEALKQNLLANQVGIDGAINPSQKEINAHIRKLK